MLFGAKWLASVEILKILGLSVSLRTLLGESFSYLAYVKGNTKFILANNLAHTISKLTIGTFFIIYFGPVGAAYYFCTMYVSITFFSRAYIIKKVFGKIYFYSPVWQPVLATLVAFCLSMIFMKYNIFTIGIINISIVLFFPVYFLTLISFDKQLRSLIIK